MEKGGLKEALASKGATRGAAVGFGDEFKIGLYGSARRVLAPRGVKVRQKVELARDWYDLAIAVDAKRGKLAWSWIPSLKGEAIAPAVESWRKQGFEFIVWDGYPSHNSPPVRQSGISLVQQPPASPELNPAERVGQAIRAEIEGRVYGSIWRKMAATESFLQKLAADKQRVRSLVGWDWILQSLRQLPSLGS